jgi:hypothetical protein
MVSKAFEITLLLTERRRCQTEIKSMKTPANLSGLMAGGWLWLLIWLWLVLVGEERVVAVM